MKLFLLKVLDYFTGTHKQMHTHTHANILCSKTSMTPLYVRADRYISSWSIHIFIESTETHWNFNVNDVNNVAVPPSIYSSDMPRFRLDWKIATQAVWAAVCVSVCVFVWFVCLPSGEWSQSVAGLVTLALIIDEWWQEKERDGERERITQRRRKKKRNRTDQLIRQHESGKKGLMERERERGGRRETRQQRIRRRRTEKVFWFLKEGKERMEDRELANEEKWDQWRDRQRERREEKGEEGREGRVWKRWVTCW